MYPITTSVLTVSEKDLELLEEICEPYFVLDPYVKNVRGNIVYLKQSILQVGK